MLVHLADGSRSFVIDIENKIDAPVGCTFKCLTYRTVIKALGGALAKKGADGTTGNELACHYLEILRSDIVPEPQSDIDAPEDG